MELSKICKYLENDGGQFSIDYVMTYSELIALYRALKYANEAGADIPHLKELFEEYSENIARCEIVLDKETIELKEMIASWEAEKTGKEPGGTGKNENN